MEKGFTLTELLVGLAIVALVASISVVGLPSVSRQQRLCRETRRLQLLLDRARLRSLATAGLHTVALTPNYAELRDSRGASLERLPIPEGLALSTTGNVAQELSFYPSHTATPATITLSLGALSATLIVSLRGRTRVLC